MSDDRCAKCGEELKSGALTCWACGTLTAAGRKAKGLPEDEEETWRRSVEAAKVRHTQAPAVDPDEVLRQVVAKTGTEEQLQRVASHDPAHDTRSGYARLRSLAETCGTLGLLLAVLLSLVGVVCVVLALIVAPGGTGILLALVGVILFGVSAISTYFVHRYIAEATIAFADLSDNARRSVLLLREALAAKDLIVNDKDGE